MNADWWLAALALPAFLAVLWPLFRSPETAAASRAAGDDREARLDILRQQMSELEQDHQNGQLDQAAYQSARRELELALLEADQADAPAGRSRRWVPGLGLLLLVVLPLGALGLFQQLRQPLPTAQAAPDAAAPAVAGGVAAGAPSGAPDIEQMVTRLHMRLLDQPGDPAGWAMLGRSYRIMEQPQAAMQAYAQGLEHNPDAPDLLADSADLLAAMQGGRLDGEPLTRLQRVMELDPDHPKGLWLLGTHAYHQGELEQARRHWTRLLGVLPASSHDAQAISANLAELEREIAAQGE